MKVKIIIMSIVDNFYSIKYKTTFFSLSAIKNLLTEKLSLLLQEYQLSSELSSTKLKEILETMHSQTYLFDQMSVLSNIIEDVSYIYIASSDSNFTFIDSFDTELEISSSGLYNTFYENIEDSNMDISNIDNDYYTCFTKDDEFYIGIQCNISDKYSISVICKTYNDDSVQVSSTQLTSSSVNYGFSICAENQIDVASSDLSSSNQQFFEYAS